MEVWSVMVFRAIALATMERNCLLSVSIMLRRILLSMLLVGKDSAVATRISRSVAVNVLMKRACGLVFFVLVAIWKVVSATFAAADP